MDDPQEVVAWGPIDGEPPVGLDVRAEHPTMVDAFDKAAVHYCVTSGCGIIQDPDFARGGNNMRIICPDKNCCLAFHYTRRTRGNCKKVFMVKERGDPPVLVHSVGCTSRPQLNSKQMSMLPGMKERAAKGGRISLREVNAILASAGALDSTSTVGARVQRAVRAGQHAEYSAGGGSNTSWGKAKGFFEEFKAQNPSCKVEVEFDKNGRCNWVFAMVDGATAELLEGVRVSPGSPRGGRAGPLAGGQPLPPSVPSTSGP